MHFKVLLINCFLFLKVNGFLFDDRTKPPALSGQTVTDTHFNMLMDLLTEERHARLKQNTKISQLENELIATQQGVTTNFIAAHSGNDTVKTILVVMEGNMRKMVSNYSNLQNEYNLVKAELNELKFNVTRTNQYASLLEQELSNVKQLKSVANLQTVVNLTDDAKRLEHELQITNNKMSSIANDVSARKQDFIALYNKAEFTEHSLDLALKTIETNFSSQTQYTDDSLNKSISYIEKQLQMLKSMQTVSTGKLEKEIHSMSDRVAVTACALDKTYSSGEKVLFPYVHTSFGVTDSVTTSMKSTGIFKCEKPGLYLLSSFIMTNTNGWYYLRKNGDVVAFGYFSLNGNYQTSTIVQLILLSVNDTLFIENAVSKRIVGDRYSCISILQLTG
ncbi:myosin-J heavy chain-like [Mytilus edulis]|uniref:myosin-J heavy chain-like n=1 Tax=Mytilus edulis TaxID=6550 RepID=UPI0039EF7503